MIHILIHYYSNQSNNSISDEFFKNDAIYWNHLIFCNYSHYSSSLQHPQAYRQLPRLSLVDTVDKPC